MKAMTSEDVAGHRLHVAVLDDHWATRVGLAGALREDGRLSVVAEVATITELAKAAGSYDICVLDLSGVGTREELESLLASGRSVVVTGSEEWRVLAGGWALGAANVFNKSVQGAVLAQALWDAVHEEPLPGPHLARALLDAADECPLSLSGVQRAVLLRAQDGYRLAAVRRELDLTGGRLGSELMALRAACRDRGLASLAVAGEPASRDRHMPPQARSLTVSQWRVLELLADGCGMDEIARSMGISEETAQNHLDHAMNDKLGIRAHTRERLLIAMYLTGRHANPELLWERISHLFPA